MKNALFFLVLLSLAGCSGKHNNPAPPSPEKVVLNAPAQNSICVSGTIVSNAISEITFTWNASLYTESYDLHIVNLLTHEPVATQTTTATKLAVQLSRSTPYSWYVVSRSSSATVTSDTWKFYNSGSGVVSYAPFPADIISPAFGTNITSTSGAINLTWKGSEVNNGALTYDVYFGKTTTPVLLKSGITDMFLNNVPVTSGTTYYWRIVSKDTQNNSSDSGLYQFSIN